MPAGATEANASRRSVRLPHHAGIFGQPLTQVNVPPGVTVLVGIEIQPSPGRIPCEPTHPSAGLIAGPRGLAWYAVILQPDQAHQPKTGVRIGNILQRAPAHRAGNIGCLVSLHALHLDSAPNAGQAALQLDLLD